MKKHIDTNIKAHLTRSAFYVLLLSLAVCMVPFVLAQRNANRQSVTKVGNALPVQVSHRAFTFAERVAYQRAIEEVYWRHRIWPKERPDPKPPLDAVMSQTQIEKKVRDYLRDSEMLEDYWQRPISAEQLQAEMDRMAQDTKQPEVLRELFEALGNDPFVIAECLARPILTERLIADVSTQHQTGRLASLRTAKLRTMSVVTMLGQFAYTLPVIGNPSGGCIDYWVATTTTNAPTARTGHTAVWTGSEMIVWGGDGPNVVNTGGRYIPSTDSWTATSTTDAPTARGGHTAVWTGSEMIVWGGGSGPPPHVLNTGGRYNPSTDSWTATSTTNAPDARSGHTAVWTDGEMIVWGGSTPQLVYFNSGGRYNPSTDSWTATSITNAPHGRGGHTAVWTGSEMIVWGGAFLSGVFQPTNTGGRYDPSSDSWTATSTDNAPAARYLHTAVWTGSEMIAWGGIPGPLSTGGRYDPGTDSWTATSITNAPEARYSHTAVWDDLDNLMIVWGGGDGSGNYFNTGGRYCGPCIGRCKPTPRPRPTPAPRP